MIEILTAAAVFGFSLGFSQEMAKELRRMLRRHRRPSRMGPPKGSYGPRQPEQPLAADMIRYARWRDEQIQRACTEPIRFDEGSTARTTSRTGPTAAKPSIVPTPQRPATRRVYYDMPSTIAECGGPCSRGPEHCDCGTLWRDVSSND